MLSYSKMNPQLAILLMFIGEYNINNFISLYILSFLTFVEFIESS